MSGSTCNSPAKRKQVCTTPVAAMQSSSRLASLRSRSAAWVAVAASPPTRAATHQRGIAAVQARRRVLSDKLRTHRLA